MRVDSLALQMRPRAALEASDLGIRLCQSTAGAVYRCYFLVALPMCALALALFEVNAGLPMLLLWCSKPWLDRTVLFVLARAAFGQQTRVRDLWNEQRDVWWRQFFLTWTWRRLSPWRSMTQPVYQLEGLSFFETRKRVLQVRRKYNGSGLMMTSAFSFAESGLTAALLSLVFWFAPAEQGLDFSKLFTAEGGETLRLLSTLAYMLAILFLEPFYVAAGFGMYLNRRAELEAWDIEQEFRRAFPA